MDNFEESNIKTMNDIFLGTPENMVFCLNESISVRINNLINKKACTVIDCSKNWKSSRKMILSKTRQCVDECPSNYKFFNDYTCVFRCPNGSFPDDFVCQELIKDNINNKTCSIKKFFLGICDMKLKTLKQKQKFVERTNYEITNGDLYELIIEAIDKKKRFPVRDGNEIYQIYALSDKTRDKDLVYIDMEECSKELWKKMKCK